MVLHQGSVPETLPKTLPETLFEALTESIPETLPESLPESLVDGLPITPPEDLELDTVPVCCHHWIIEAANGPISRGVCQKCFESREFKNSVFGMEREYSETPTREETAAKESMGALEE